MGTRGVIARVTEDGWEGRYHHWDSYPSCLGKALYDLHGQGTFHKTTDEMIMTLITNHPAGWSTIVNCDWTQEPGFLTHNHRMTSHREGKQDRPQCYCHGDRHEGAILIKSIDPPSDLVWCYILYRVGWEDYMDVLSSYHGSWEKITTVNLRNREPNWGEIGQKGTR